MGSEMCIRDSYYYYYYYYYYCYYYYCYCLSIRIDLFNSASSRSRTFGARNREKETDYKQQSCAKQNTPAEIRTQAHVVLPARMAVDR